MAGFILHLLSGITSCWLFFEYLDTRKMTHASTILDAVLSLKAKLDLGLFIQSIRLHVQQRDSFALLIDESSGPINLGLAVTGALLFGILFVYLVGFMLRSRPSRTMVYSYALIVLSALVVCLFRVPFELAAKCPNRGSALCVNDISFRFNAPSDWCPAGSTLLDQTSVEAAAWYYECWNQCIQDSIPFFFFSLYSMVYIAVAYMDSGRAVE